MVTFFLLINHVLHAYGEMPGKNRAWKRNYEDLNKSSVSRMEKEITESRNI